MNIEKLVNGHLVSLQKRLARLTNIYILLAIAMGAIAGCAVVLFNNPLYILLALFGIVVFLVSLYSEDFGLLVLVFTSYSRFSDILIEYHGFVSFAKPFIAVLVATILVRWGLFGERPKGWLRPAILFGLFSLTGLFSLFYSPVPDRVMNQWFDDLKDILIAMIVVVLLQRGPMFRRVLWTLVAVGLFLGNLSVIQYFTGTFDNDYGGFAISQEHQIVGEVDDFRSTGPIGDPNFFAQIMVVLVPIAFERFLHEKRTSLRLLALWAFGVSVLSVIFTYSRGGFLAMAAGMLIIFLYYPPRGIQIPVLIFSMTVFALLLPPNYVERLSTLTELFTPTGNLRTEEMSLRGRLSENLTAIEMVKTNPLFGVGLNSFNYLFPEYSKKLGLALVATEREAHNLYLEVAAETGLIGFLVLVIVLGACMRTLLRARGLFERADMPEYSGMVTGFMAGLVGYLVAALYIHNAFPRYFFLLLGIAMAVRLVVENTVDHHQNPDRELVL